jgi:hypothetical protein
MLASMEITTSVNRGVSQKHASDGSAWRLYISKFHGAPVPRQTPPPHPSFTPDPLQPQYLTPHRTCAFSLLVQLL